MHKLRAVTEKNNRRVPFLLLPLKMFVFTIFLSEPDFFYASLCVCMKANWKK